MFPFHQDERVGNRGSFLLLMTGGPSGTVTKVPDHHRQPAVPRQHGEERQPIFFSSSKFTDPFWLVNARECPWLCCWETPLMRWSPLS